MAFLSPVEYKDIGDGEYQLCKALVYISKAGQTYTVPKGFITDLATIPDKLHFILPPDGDYEESAVLHDYLLKDGYSRSRASSLFFESMVEDDVYLVEAIILFIGAKARDWYVSLKKRISRLI